MANEEACALEAESLQLEQEAYFVRNQGKGKGHGGFQPHRSFDISGQVSFQERKARLAQLKAKTECRRCGAKGHWSGDPQCPKSPRKSFGSGARKGSSSTSKGSSSTSAGGGKRDGKQKPRVVYFSMGEEKPEDQGPTQRFAGMALERGGAQVPPPSSLSSPMRLSSTMASSSTSSIAAAPQVGQPGFLGLLDQETLQRAQQLREVSRMQAQQQHHAVVHSPQQDPSAEDLLLRRALDQGVALQQQDPVLGAVFNVLANMEVDEEANQPVASGFDEIEVVKGVTSYEIADVYGQEPIAPGYVRTSEGYVVPIRDAATTEARHRYLDEYLEKVPQDQRDTAEYRDAYQERWSEFVPGHPLFTESDAANLQRWNQKQLQGEPRLPDSKPTPPLPAAAVLQTSGPLPSSTTTAVAVVASGGGCEHKRITKKGTNKYYYMETCLDCHKVIKKEPKEQPKITSVPTTSTGTTPSTCEHHNVSWQGSNGHQWKNTCKDCGFSTSGFYRDGQSGIRRPGAKTRSSKPSSGQPSLLPIGNSNKAAQMFHTCMVVASVMGDQEVAAELGPGDLHRILDAVIAGTSLTTTSTRPSPSEAQPRTDPDSLGSHPKDYKVVNFGEYKGRTFAEAYGSPGYVKWCEENVGTDSCRGLKELCEYFRQKKREKTHTSYMAIEYDDSESPAPEEPGEIHSETDLIAILDLGCNKTCHGEKWLRRFQIATSTPEIPLDDQCSTSFKGIGGIVNTNGVRHMNVCFELEDGGLAVGDLKSTELKDSEAPLLLSIADQRKLGLSVQLADTGDKVFSSRLNGYLKVAEINGLLGIRLIPSELALLTLGASPDGVDHAPATLEDTEQSPTSTTAPMTSASLPDPPVPEETETFLIIEDEPRKTLTKNQKKYFDSSINEVKAADWGLWSTLRKDQHPPLPKGCKVFLMEIFAGAAVLTSLALSMQLPVAAPVDIKIDGTDLLNPKVRAKIEEDIERLDPFCLTFAPECAPWGSWSRLNMTRSSETHDYIQGQRDAWYPCLQWVRKIIKQRLARGRKVLLENPWGSELWSTLCISKLIAEGPIDSETLEPLELVRGDQCSFGLRDHQTGDLHYKPTGFLTASKPVKIRLQQRCDGLHTHQPLEGGSRTKKAQQWPVLLCKAMLYGFLEELQERTMNAAFHVEAHMEEELEQPKAFDLGTLDYVHNEQDVARTTATSTAIDDHELQRQEQMEELDSPTQLMEVEVERKRKWLQVPKDIRIALRRLHHMTGHGSSASMLQLLRTAGASPKALEAARHFACETCRKRQPTQRPPTVKEPSKLIFNHEVSVDCFEIHDSAGNRHTVLSMLCLGTLFHQAWWVATGGVPRSGVCAEMILNGWLQPYGAPQLFTCDRGVHNQGRVKDLLRIHGIQLRYAGLEAPYQIGRTERQGGIFKEILKAAIEERQIIGVQDIKMLISEVAWSRIAVSTTMDSHLSNGCWENFHVKWPLWLQSMLKDRTLEYKKKFKNLRMFSADSWKSVKQQRWHLQKQTALAASGRHYFEKPSHFVVPMFQEIWCAFIVVEDGMALGELLDVKVAQLCGWFTVAFPFWWLKINFVQLPLQKFLPNRFWNWGLLGRERGNWLPMRKSRRHLLWRTWWFQELDKKKTNSLPTSTCLQNLDLQLDLNRLFLKIKKHLNCLIKMRLRMTCRWWRTKSSYPCRCHWSNQSQRLHHPDRWLKICLNLRLDKYLNIHLDLEMEDSPQLWGGQWISWMAYHVLLHLIPEQHDQGHLLQEIRYGSQFQRMKLSLWRIFNIANRCTFMASWRDEFSRRRDRQELAVNSTSTNPRTRWSKNLRRAVSRSGTIGSNSVLWKLFLQRK